MRHLTSSWIVVLGLLAGVAASVPAPARAQDPAQERTLGAVSRGPRFLVARGDQPVPIDVRQAPMLHRRISVDFKGVTLKEALAEISRQARLPLMYSKDIVPLESRVRLRADHITVAGVLSEVLMDAGVDVLLSNDGRAALVRRGAPVVRAVQGGTIVGRVTDAKSGDPLSAAEVFLEGTRWRVPSAQDGRFRLSDVAPGSYTLVARRVGYGRESRGIVVAEGAEVTVEVALQPVATQLNEIVTTVTGDQQRVELGHVVGRINADSVVREAPVSTLSELLTARVSGLQVFQTQGTVGGRVDVRVRGPNSPFFPNQPIVVIDGVRYTTEERRALFGNGGPNDVEPSSPLNDINPNDIESIEVVKGPSAATLYGTDAANGVLVITTKRGRPGPARWNAYAKGTSSVISRHEFPDIYWGWGTVSGIPNNRTLSCTLTRLASRQCTQQDSITVRPNPLNEPQSTIFGNQPNWEYGMNVSGGRQDLRYYFAADFDDATGPVVMPLAMAEELKQAHGLQELPEEWRKPNSLSKLSFRSSVNAALGEIADLRVSTGYVKRDSRNLSRLFNPYGQAFFGSTPDSAYGVTSGSNPAQAFAQTKSQRTDRFWGSSSGRWQPVRWLEARATLGLDLTSSVSYGLTRPGDQPNGRFPTGAVEDSRSRQMITTADLGIAATARLGRVRARTALGTQYTRTFSTASGSFGQGLPPGGAVVQRAVTIQTRQTHLETVVLGGYIEETLGFNERVFLTGALRLDGASTFGRTFQAAVYPKVGASWLISEEPFLPRLPGLDEFRLRYAFGASGRQPDPSLARPRFLAGSTWLGGQQVNTVELLGPGNPDLGPERVREHEFGFDATALTKRLAVDITWYRRRTTDMHIGDPGIPVGSATVGPLRNLGLVTQRGFEAQIDIRVLDTRRLSWNLSLKHSDYMTRLDDLGGGAEWRTTVSGGGYVLGLPLGGRFQVPVVGWQDVDGDGFIDPNVSEVQRGDSTIYYGQSIPPRSQTLTSTLGLFQRRLRLSVLLERKSGFTQYNPYWCAAEGCRAAVDPSTPVAEQVQALQFTGPIPEKADFTRLREVTAALDLPSSFTRAVHLHSATLVASARNLALWTNFSGPDPEVGPTGSFSSFDLAGAAGIPLARVFSFRVDLGF